METFPIIIATINSLAMVDFFEIISSGIFEHLLGTDSKKERFLSFISTYFGTIKINGKQIWHLHCLV